MYQNLAKPIDNDRTDEACAKFTGNIITGNEKVGAYPEHYKRNQHLHIGFYGFVIKTRRL